jgi:hypothetical protein
MVNWVCSNGARGPKAEEVELKMKFKIETEGLCRKAEGLCRKAEADGS